jgi:hypothetical protein
VEDVFLQLGIDLQLYIWLVGEVLVLEEHSPTRNCATQM